MIRIIFIVLLFFITFSSVFSQFPYNSSLDIPSDSRSISMGESFVAVKHPISSLLYNPASYSGKRGLIISYSLRRANFFDQINETKLYNFSMSYSSILGEFGFMYNRYDWGEGVVTLNDPTPIGKVHFYDHVFLAKYSKLLLKNFSVGIIVKTFNFVESQTEGIPVPLNETSSLPILIDIGSMYSTTLAKQLQSIHDELIFGCSIQNYGTDYRVKSPPDPVGQIEEHFEKLPRYLRFGFSYSLKFKSPLNENLTPVQLLLTGEYRNLLNADERQNDSRDFWGYGSEISFFEVFSFRLGGYINPYRSVYGEKGKPSTRFGFGLNIPFERIVPNIPITLSFDYSNIPLNTSVYNGWDITANNSLDVFTISLKYNKNLFSKTESE
ncbi:MAG: hypothetical protein HY960_10155 [Ignavibacteriae bacterium]|nr:hypothetical protein [Ignavibacteriota bacterium]